MARIHYPDTVDPSVQLMPATLNVFRMMSHAAALTGPTVGLGRAILGSGALPPRLREQVIMLVAAHCRCAYEAAQHTPIAVDAGVTPAQLSSIADGDLDPELFGPAAHAALSAARELLTAHTWSPSTVASLQEHHTDPQIVELALTVGYYTMLAGLMNGLDIDIDPLGSRFTALANGR